MHKSRFTETLVTFIVLTIVLTLIEWLGGIIIENLFHETLWNYKNFQFNIGKYISLEMALIWGLISIFIIFFIKPIIDKIEKKIPKTLTYTLLIFFIIDIITTIITKIK